VQQLHTYNPLLIAFIGKHSSAFSTLTATAIATVADQGRFQALRNGVQGHLQQLRTELKQVKAISAATAVVQRWNHRSLDDEVCYVHASSENAQGYVRARKSLAAIGRQVTYLLTCVWFRDPVVISFPFAWVLSRWDDNAVRMV
jgi:chromosome condensin MukBEF ATPase and DNA-binding subunit MukB